ncbi:hypothetical protein JCM11491_004906 [Sporobolomyces phaffii]
MDGIPLDPYEQQVLTREQASLYLDRIGLAQSAMNEPPSLSLLSRLLLAQVEQVPLDTSALHVTESQWTAPPSRIKLSSALADMPEGLASFDRVVHRRRGAFCFGINATFSAFLRSFGFRVSEIVSRAFKSLGIDPLTHPDGWKWGTLTHQVMVVDWEGSDGRYFVDAAWGPWSPPVPIKLCNGETVKGLNDYEAFRLVEEHLPLSSTQTQPIDRIKGWTLYRRISPPGLPVSFPVTSASPGYWSPFFHFDLVTTPLLDFRLFHHFSACHKLGVFTAFWLVTRLIPDSGGARRTMMYAEKAGKGTQARVYTTGGHDAKGSLDGRDVEWVEMETGATKAYLEKEFGFRF